MASMMLLNKSVYSIVIKGKCLISIFMNINEKQEKEKTKLISVYGMACDIYIFVTYLWVCGCVREREREKERQREKEKEKQILQKCMWIIHMFMVYIATHTAVPKNKKNK